MRIQFYDKQSVYGRLILTCRMITSSTIARLDVDLCEITFASDLNVILCLHKVHALQRAIRDLTGAATGLRAPCNLFALSVTNTTDLRGCPQAEVIDIYIYW